MVRLERAVRRFRLQSAHNLLDEAFATHSPEAVLRDVAVPLFRRLEADGDPAAVRLAASIFELRLLAQARGWERVRGPLVVLACAPREEHVLALIGLGIALAERHCRISYLGAATPPDVLREAAREQDAAIAVLSVERDDLTAPERAELAALAGERPLVVVGGARVGLARTLGAVAGDADAVACAPRIAGMACIRRSIVDDS